MNILVCIKCKRKFKRIIDISRGADEFASFLDRDYMNDQSQAWEKLMGRKSELGEGNNFCPKCKERYENILKHTTEERLSKIKWYYED